MSGGDEIILKMIQECIRTGRFAFTSHALRTHPLKEGFTAQQALASIANGQMIEHRPAECRCLICGPALGLRTSREYITTYIHTVCKYDDVRRIVVITMYRPRSDQWINPFTRRKTT